MIVIETYAQDSAPLITLNLVREDGTIPNITGAMVWLNIYDPDTGICTNEPSGTTTNLCEVTNGLAGQCVYQFNSSGNDCPDPGIYSARLKIQYVGGGLETTAIRISASNPIARIS